jgi:CRISPR-associated protein Cas1
MQTLDHPELTKQNTIRVSALHALAYCPRLFYLEEVEELYTQDAAVFAGRRLHTELEKQEDEEWEELFLESEELGLRGRVDALRTGDRKTIPYEHTSVVVLTEMRTIYPKLGKAIASKFSPMLAYSNQL